MVLFGFFLYFFQDHSFILMMGSNAFSIFAYIISTTIMVSAFIKIKDHRRFFWLWFSLGGICLLISQLYWTLHQIKFENFPYGYFGDFIWLAGYVFILIGLIYQMKILRDTIPMVNFLFNIVIIMIVSFSFSWYFVTGPIISNYERISSSHLFVMTSYFILNFSMLFAVVCLIFSSTTGFNKIILNLITFAITIQIIADTIYNYQSFFGYYTNGQWVNLVWPFSQLLIGLSAVISSGYQTTLKKSQINLGTNSNMGFIITYICASALLIITMILQLEEINVLQMGLNFIMILIIFSQVFTKIENKKIIEKLSTLADSETKGKDELTSKKKGNEIERLFNQIEDLVYLDPLTKLANRTLFHRKAREEVIHSMQKNNPLSLFYIDMDRFKYVNDRIGHDGGDLLLKGIAARFINTVNDNSVTISRMSGDEFIIMLPGRNKENCIELANTILKEFSKPFLINGHKIFSTPSIGISLFPEHGETVDELVKNADTAMYLAKEEGKNNFKFYHPVLQQLVSRKIRIESSLRTAIQEAQFTLNYQPQIELSSGDIVAVEALIRWNNSDLGNVSPNEFIPIAEETGLIESIGTWVMETACRQMAEWHQSGLPKIEVAVNVSAKQFQDPLFLGKVKDILIKTKLDPNYLKIEVTESVLQNVEEMMNLLNNLKALGIKIAIDDFGKGYSSLNYLKHLPIDCLKIDKSFVDELATNPAGPLLKSIINLGKSLNFQVIAEGIELKNQVEFLKRNQCTIAQGYFFSRPMAASDFEVYASNHGTYN